MADRDRFSDDAAAGKAGVARMTAELGSAHQTRDQAVANLQASETHISSARSTIARLEQCVTELHVDHAELEALQRQIGELKAHSTAATGEIAILGTVWTVTCDYNALRTQVAGFVSLVRPIQQTPVSSQSSPVAGSGRKRGATLMRCLPDPRTLRCLRLEVPLLAARQVVMQRFLLIHDLQRSATQLAPRSSSSDEDPVLAALTRSRSEHRRNSGSSRGSGGSTVDRPIEVGTSPSSDSSIDEDSDHDDDVPQADVCEPSPGNYEVGDPDDPSGSAPGGLAGHVSDRSAQADGGPSAEADDLPSDDDSFASSAPFLALPASRVGRALWIPGYRVRVTLAVAYVEPWPASQVAKMSVSELTVDLLFKRFSKPPSWIFPPKESPPDPHDWSERLIDEGNVSAVYASVSWRVLAVTVQPVSFVIDGPSDAPLRVMSHRWTELKAKHLQALWEASHSFPIPERAAWKRLLPYVLRCIEAGVCDLDIFLDPYFLHFPRREETSVWYPGLGCDTQPANLFQALMQSHEETSDNL
ncbi:hypothetical protein PHMEG_00031246 [Phytophthora megakarya]|uniref:Uncharacterized protein n=1 Tax=Phytophthora megakarya TaxID=4795 RepID=A0A225UYH1_9STRA|nr:hypothetical protein PHMEG_00031246 [Phytophthora megakarya]